MRLADYLIREELSYAEFGRRAALSRQAIERYAKGMRRPDRDAMPRIKAASGGEVTANDFEDDLAPAEQGAA